MSREHPTFGERLFWRLEALGFDLAATLLRLAPLDAASDFGGWLLRRLGPLTGTDRTIRRNLELAFPELSAAERDRIRLASWEEFGRFAAEFPMLDRLTPASGRIEVIGGERLRAIAESNTPTVLITGHFSNFEIMAAVIVALGVRCQITYRPANNPYFNERIITGRRRYGVTALTPKGSQGARDLMRALARGELVALLVDQKFNAGVAAPFFGHLTHTNPGAVRLARGVGGHLIPLAVRRLEGARFRMTVYEPMVLPDTGDRVADTEAGVRQLNAFIEARVRERPEEWFWAHRRWPKAMYADKQG